VLSDASRIDQAAHALAQAWRAGSIFDDDPDDSCLPRDLREGYAVQAAMAELIGPTIGWKIAGTNPAGRAHIGTSAPIFGRLFDDGLIESAGSTGTLRMGVAEAEFVFRMRDDLPPREEPYGEDEVVAAADAVFLAIELPDSRFRDFVAAGAFALAADQACGRAFVLGPAVSITDAPALVDCGVRAIVDGRVVSAGTGANVLGDPRLALAWIANELNTYGQALQAGEYVTTGTVTPPIPYHAGSDLRAEFGDLGSVSVRLS